MGDETDPATAMTLALPQCRPATLLLAVAVLLFSLVPAFTQDGGRYDTRIPQAILIDVETGSVLFEKAADERAPPGSMAKMMTMAVVFAALRDGTLTLDQEFKVSEDAWRKGGAPSRGTTMFAALNSSIRVEDLIRGVIVQSANDGCIVLAEGMAGSQEAFAALMNKEAERLGLENTRFANPTGYADPGQYASVRDLARLAAYLIREFPEYYRIYAEPEFTWNKIRQLNRNPLLSLVSGSDGLTTGSTEESGFGLAGTAVRDGQRLILVVNRAETEKIRNDEVRKLFEWGFNEFERVQLFDAGTVIAEARVFNGAQSRVGLVSHAPVQLLMPLQTQVTLRAEVIYDGPLEAPVQAGRVAGVVRVITSDGLSVEAPVYTAADVGVGPLSRRALDGLEELLLGWW